MYQVGDNMLSMYMNSIALASHVKTVAVRSKDVCVCYSDGDYIPGQPWIQHQHLTVGGTN